MKTQLSHTGLMENQPAVYSQPASRENTMYCKAGKLNASPCTCQVVMHGAVSAHSPPTVELVETITGSEGGENGNRSSVFRWSKPVQHLLWKLTCSLDFRGDILITMCNQALDDSRACRCSLSIVAHFPLQRRHPKLGLLLKCTYINQTNFN